VATVHDRAKIEVPLPERVSDTAKDNLIRVLNEWFKGVEAETWKPREQLDIAWGYCIGRSGTAVRVRMRRYRADLHWRVVP